MVQWCGSCLTWTLDISSPIPPILSSDSTSLNRARRDFLLQQMRPIRKNRKGFRDPCTAEATDSCKGFRKTANQVKANWLWERQKEAGARHALQVVCPGNNIPLLTHPQISSSLYSRPQVIFDYTSLNNSK